MSNESNYEPDWDELGIDPNEAGGTSSDAYVPTSQFPPPPPIGNYTFAGVEGTQKWGNSGGKLYVRGTFTVVGGEFDGKKVDAFISSRPTPYRTNGTDLDDFLKASGIAPKDGKQYTNSEISDIVKSTWGKPRKGYLTWEGYCSNCKATVARGKKDAKNANAKTGIKAVGFQVGDALSPIVSCPKCGTAVQAKGKIQKWYVA